MKIEFTKMVASGNDFIVIEGDKLSAIAKKACDRKYGIGADGLIVLAKSRIADIKMRIFNADGSEAEMCGNGARCAALWAKRRGKGQGERVKIETKAGLIEAEIAGDKIRIKLTNPKGIKLDIPIKVNNRALKINFINTGVPHAVIFVEGLDKINVADIGRALRYHKKFSPRGTNVDFVEVLNSDSIKVRTYERGVEDETLACGTGSVASALIASIKYQVSSIKKMNIQTQGGEILRIYFERISKGFENVWLEGKARIVHKGEYYV